MPAPKFEHPSPLTFGGYEHPRSYEDSRAVVLPVPFERTTSYVTGTRNAPREILLASGQVEQWDEETGTDVWTRGIFTLPEMDLPFNEVRVALDEIKRVAEEVAAGKFLVVLEAYSVSVPSGAVAAGRRACRSGRSTLTPICATQVRAAAYTPRCAIVYALRQVDRSLSRGIPVIPGLRRGCSGTTMRQIGLIDRWWIRSATRFM
jgi:hypothetical protein